MSDRMKKLEVVVNCAILVAVVLLGWKLLQLKTQPKPEPAEHYGEKLVGTTLPEVAPYVWSHHPETLVMAIRIGCHFCEESMPLYQRLSALEKAGTLHAHVLAVMPDPPAAGSELLRSHGLDIDAIFGRPLSGLDVSGTPTLLLLNSQGRIDHAWVGELRSKDEEDALITTLKN